MIVCATVGLCVGSRVGAVEGYWAANMGRQYGPQSALWETNRPTSVEPEMRRINNFVLEKKT